jgi:hypothetical protein
MSTPELEIALDTFRRIQERFPQLTMKLDREHPHVDVALDIPQQPGLTSREDAGPSLRNRR